MIEFFERSRALVRILTVICVIIAIPIFPFFIFEFRELVGGYVDIEHLLFIGLLSVLFIVLVVLIIAIKLIIKDAQEDISAAMNYKNEDLETKCKNQHLH